MLLTFHTELKMDILPLDIKCKVKWSLKLKNMLSRLFRARQANRCLYTKGLFKVWSLTVPQATPGPGWGFLAGFVDTVFV